MIIPFNTNKVHLEVYDMSKNILGILSDNTPFTTSKVNINKTINDVGRLTFSISCNNEKFQYLKNENLIKVDDKEYYVIKKLTLDSENTMVEVECEHEATKLKDKIVGKIDKIAEKAGDLISLVLEDTGWTFGGTDIPDNTKRHLQTNETSVFSNLVTIAENFNARLEFSIENVNGIEIKSVCLYASYIDRGRYVRKRRDLKKVNLVYDTNNMATRLTVFGKADDATQNEISMMPVHPQHKSYVDNFEYFKKQGYTDEYINNHPMDFVKELIIRNTELPTPQAVYDYAIEQVKKISVPKITAEVELMDISTVEDFLTTPIEEGEVIRIFDEDINLELEANVVSIDKTDNNPLDVTVGISNVIEINSTLKDLVESSNLVEKIIDGQSQKIHGMWIKDATIGSAQIGKAAIGKAQIGEAVIESAHIGEAQITSAHIQDAAIKSAQIDEAAIRAAHIDEAQITSAHIQDAAIGKAHIQNAAIESAHIDIGAIKAANIDTAAIKSAHIDNAQITSAHIAKGEITSAHIAELDANKIDFNLATGDVLDLQTLLAKFVSVDSGQFLNINSLNSVIADATIKNAMIENIDVNKILAGNISTNKFNIVSDDGGINIVGSTQQFRDKDGNVRVQIGKDEHGNFTLLIIGEDGSTVLLDSKGLKEGAIADKLIKSEMVADNAIGREQINYSSLITGLNESGNSELIKASKVEIDLEGQRLDLAFKELKQNINYDVEILSTNGNVFKNGQISTKLIAIVRKGIEDVTDTIDASRFRWTRVSNDEEGDKAWNQAHFGGAKEIIITKDDVKVRATFNCEILEI